MQNELTKFEQLNILSAAIHDQFENYEGGQRIADTHHILYAGDPEAKIAVVQMYPDKAELNWATREETHNGYVCTGPSSHTFKNGLKDAGFNPDKDFFYTNVIPFYPLGGAPYPYDVVRQLIWIFDGIMEIIEPRIIITLGFDVFKIFYPDMYDRQQFERILKEKDLLEPINIEDKNYIIAALEDPKKVSTENVNKNKPFYSTLKQLFTIKHYYTGEHNGRPNIIRKKTKQPTD